MGALGANGAQYMAGSTGTSWAAAAQSERVARFAASSAEKENEKSVVGALVTCAIVGALVAGGKVGVPKIVGALAGDKVGVLVEGADPPQLATTHSGPSPPSASSANRVQKRSVHVLQSSTLISKSKSPSAQLQTQSSSANEADIMHQSLTERSNVFT